MFSREKTAGATGSLLPAQIRHWRTSRHWHPRDLPSWLQWRRGESCKSLHISAKKSFLRTTLLRETVARMWGNA